MKDWPIEERYKKIDDPNNLTKLYEEVKNSKYKQKIHISPLTGLLNDPNGFTYYNGMWHLFYQWFPWGPVHGIKYWYHVVSEDLIHWKNLGIGLKPDTNYDDYGVHSGSSLVDRDQLYLCFTANHRDKNWNRIASTMLAQLKDDKFVKQELPLFGPNPNYTENQRDPNIFYNKKRNKYFIFLGAQNKNNKPKILVYSSNKVGEGWEFKGELKVEGYEEFGEMWECPN